MRRTLLIMVLVLGSCTSNPRPIKPFDISSARASSVLVQSGRGIGSGVCVNGVIITCSHVVKDVDNVYVVFQDRIMHKAKVSFRNEEADIVHLILEVPFVSLKTGKAKMGDRVYMYSNPLGMLLIYSEGYVMGKEGDSYIISTEAFFGSSGAGVFNSEGEVIGIARAMLKDSGILLVTPIKDAF